MYEQLEWLLKNFKIDFSYMECRFQVVVSPILSIAHILFFVTVVRIQTSVHLISVNTIQSNTVRSLLLYCCPINTHIAIILKESVILVRLQSIAFICKKWSINKKCYISYKIRFFTFCKIKSNWIRWNKWSKFHFQSLKLDCG